MLALDAVVFSCSLCANIGILLNIILKKYIKSSCVKLGTLSSCLLGRLIRKQAVALKTMVHDLVKTEIDEELQESCQKIKEARCRRANDSKSNDAPVPSTPQSGKACSY